MDVPDAASRKILVVDDIDTNRLALRHFLKPYGFQIVEASDGVEALERVAEDPPDLVLLDVMMPRKNGLEVCRNLKNNEETRLIPIIMITAVHEQKEKLNLLVGKYLT